MNTIQFEFQSSRPTWHYIGQAQEGMDAVQFEIQTSLGTRYFITIGLRVPDEIFKTTR
jgi:hypothetical protein